LDTSVIRELPPGRQPVQTRRVTEDRRDKVYERLRDELRRGRQGYFVCPLVAGSEALDLKAAEQTYVELREGPFRDFRLGLLHGRLDERDKHAVMDQFRRGGLDVLVCTTVIEAGVDVPNATLMVI